MCERLSISRAAIWKHIKTLRELGYEIESATNRGYSLKATPDTLHPLELTACLSTRVLGRSLDYTLETASTNTLAMDAAHQSAAEGHVVVTEQQTAGKGRMNRPWYSPASQNVYMSIVLRPRVAPFKVPQLALVSGLAVLEALVFTAPDLVFGLKWPNDIFVSERKVCGILCEMDSEIDTTRHVVVGIGINVNIKPEAFPKEIRPIAASLHGETGKRFRRAKLVANVLTNLEHRYEMWHQTGLSDMLEALNAVSILNGRALSIETGSRLLSGTGGRILENGLLQFFPETGSPMELSSGDVHIDRM